MIHACPELKKCKFDNFDKPPHWFGAYLNDSPDRDGLIFAVEYSNADDNTWVGTGMKFHFCPACGEKIG